MQKKTKICLVIPSLQAGGMERVMTELSHYFCSNPKYEVHLVLYGLKRNVFYEIPSNLIIHMPSFEFNNKKRTLSTIKTLWFLRKKLKSIKPNAVLSFGEFWNNFVLLACLGMKLPIFVSDRSQPNKSLGKLHDGLRNWLYPKAAGVICQTETAKQIYRKMFKQHNLVVIGNPIREIKPNPIVKKENIVLSVGRLIESKHHDDLIKIFARINPEAWKLIIVGDDALKQRNKEKLNSLVKELGMNDKIELLGEQSNVDDFYNRAKIFAFTSSSEGFPNVIGEAMSAGLPVVGYDCIAGPRDLIVDGQTGFLVNTHDVISFENYLLELINDANLRSKMSKESLIKIKQFSVDKISVKFEKAILSENTSN